MRVRPKSEAEIVDAVRLASERGTTLRAVGSRHSLKPTYQTRGITVELDRYRAIRDLPGNQVEAEAGVVLETLCRHLDARGLALPNLGGITAQTVAGFLATGSAGGSLRHTFETSVVAIRLATASGEVVSIDRDHPWFDAAGVSLGLLGVIVSVTFRGVPKYGVRGNERPANFEQLREYFSTRPDDAAYCRGLWYPAIDRGQLWTADRTEPKKRTTGVKRLSPTFQYLANAASFVGTRARSLLVRPLLELFVEKRAHEFDGPWHEVLPQDEGLEFHRLPHEYSELWIPIGHAGDAMTALNEVYRQGGLDVLPTLPVEFYCSPPSRFWLSAGFDRPSFRVNLIRYRWDPRPSRALFEPAWRALAPFDPRAHWGKYHVPSSEGLAISRSAPRFAEFESLRHQLDPDGVFLSDYWARFIEARPSSCVRSILEATKRASPRNQLTTDA